jgi:hypothetical protein
MRKHLFGAALVALLAGPWPGSAARGQDDPPVRPKAAVKPTLVLRVKAVEDLLADFRYLATLAGREEEGKQVERMLLKRAGPKGLEGIDLKKPIGVYGNLKADVKQSEVVVLVPIADQKAFLGLLENMELEAKKGDGGVWTVEAPGVPVPVLFRFANGYVYATPKVRPNSADLLTPARLPQPADVLRGGAGDLLSLTLHVDQVPKGLRDFAANKLAEGIAESKDEEKPGETAAEKALRHAALDSINQKLKAVIQEGSTLSMKLNVDRKANDLSASFALTPRPGSALADDIAALGKFESVAAGLVTADSAAHVVIAAKLPAAVRKALGPVVDEKLKKSLDQQTDENARALTKIFFDAVAPTLKSGVFDLGVNLSGPSKGGKYGMVFGGRVKDGAEIDKALRAILAKAPAEVTDLVKTDMDRAGGTSIHQVTPPKDKTDANFKALFGEGPFYVAIRKDALMVSVGAGALPAIKRALTSEPKAGHPFQAEVSVSRVARLLGKTQKEVPGAAAKAFKGRGDDVVRLSVEAGSTLQWKLSGKAQIVTFLALLEKAKKGEE